MMKEKLKRITRILGYVLIMIVFVGGLATDQYQHCYIAMGLLAIEILMNISEILIDLFHASVRRGCELRSILEAVNKLNSELKQARHVCKMLETATALHKEIEPLRVGSFGAKGQKKLARKINEVIERKN